MSPETAADLLASLDAEKAPVVLRFDDGAPFEGRVAVLPSAYNPPTLAHLHLLDTGRDAAEAATAVALLTTRNVAKGVTGASLAERIGMLLALHGERPDIAVMASNAARIVDQATALRGANSGVEFAFVMGHDTLVRLFDTKYYDDMDAELRAFFEQHRVVATNRGEATISEVRAFVEAVAGPFAGRIILREIDDHPAGLSSTAARAEVGAGAASNAIPGAVHQYIVERGLYRER